MFVNMYLERNNISKMKIPSKGNLRKLQNLDEK